jgi:hypothetical protein
MDSGVFCIEGIKKAQRGLQARVQLGQQSAAQALAQWHEPGQGLHRRGPVCVAVGLFLEVLFEGLRKAFFEQLGHFAQQNRFALAQDVFKSRVQRGQLLQGAGTFAQLPAHLRAQAADGAFHLPLVRRIKAAIGFISRFGVQRLVQFGRGHVNAREARACGGTLRDGLHQLQADLVHMPRQCLFTQYRRALCVGRLFSGGFRVEHAVQADGLTKVQPVAQSRSHITDGHGRIHHALLGEQAQK